MLLCFWFEKMIEVCLRLPFHFSHARARGNIVVNGNYWRDWFKKDCEKWLKFVRNWNEMQMERPGKEDTRRCQIRRKWNIDKWLIRDSSSRTSARVSCSKVLHSYFSLIVLFTKCFFLFMVVIKHKSYLLIDVVYCGVLFHISSAYRQWTHRAGLGQTQSDRECKPSDHHH